MLVSSRAQIAVSHFVKEFLVSEDKDKGCLFCKLLGKLMAEIVELRNKINCYFEVREENRKSDVREA